MQTRTKAPVVAEASAKRKQDKKSKPKTKPKTSPKPGPKPGPKTGPKGTLKGSKTAPKERRVLRHLLRYSISAIDVSSLIAPSASAIDIACAGATTTTTCAGVSPATTSAGSITTTTTPTAVPTITAHASLCSRQAWIFERRTIVQLPGDDPCPAGMVEVSLRIPGNLGWLDWPERMTAASMEGVDYSDGMLR